MSQDTNKDGTFMYRVHMKLVVVKVILEIQTTGNT